MGCEFKPFIKYINLPLWQQASLHFLANLMKHGSVESNPLKKKTVLKKDFKADLTGK